MFQTVHLLKHCQIEDTMKKLYTWLCANKLTLNVTKTNYCIFQGKHKLKNDDINEINFGHNSIKRVENVKYLGMYIDEKLSWKYHIYNILKQLSKTSRARASLRSASSPPSRRRSPARAGARQLPDAQNVTPAIHSRRR